MTLHRSRTKHKTEVLSFMQKVFPNRGWEIRLPSDGTGQETYIATSQEGSYFIKLGAKTERYRVMSELGLSPRVVTTGQLADGTSMLVQEKVRGHRPSRADFHLHLEKFAGCLGKTHRSEAMQGLLPGKASRSYAEVGVEALQQVENRWKQFESQVPAPAGYVNEKLCALKDQMSQFVGNGLVASHNDVCNGNWLVSAEEEIYLLDYESMSLDDPALDLGAILWWYYPPEMRDKFIQIAGYTKDETLHTRMRTRMAIHTLNILLPRENSFDRFSAHTFEEALEDFRAVVEGKENPQGYSD